MTQYKHRKRHRGRLALWIFLLLILLAALVAIYLYIPFTSNIDGIKQVAMSPVAKSKIINTSMEPFISINPKSIQQGEPVLITVEGLNSISTIKSFTFNNIPLVMFLHKDQVTAIVGVDLRAATGTVPIILIFNDGKKIQESLVINERPLVEVPYDIPKKLGGNTPASERELTYTLATEAKTINTLPTNSEKLWTLPFGPPLKDTLVVSNTYGYTRIVGKLSMPHKGVDLEAPIGTPVYAMNRGEVIFTNHLRNYGNTVIINHGTGLSTFYLHLSEVNVTHNQIVEKGELIGLSGDTGYVLEPHLHMSVRIWDISIDPIKFLKLLGSEN